MCEFLVQIVASTCAGAAYESVCAFCCFACCCGLLLFASPTTKAGEGSFTRGAKDRTEYEEWFNGLNGEYKAGVYHWVTVRSIPGKAFCDGDADTDYKVGCLHAAERFSRIDYQRLHDPEYKLGWNSYRGAPAPTPVASSSATQVQALSTLAECAGVVGASDRLACYDRLATGNSPSLAPTSFVVPAPVPVRSIAPSKPRGEEQEAQFISVIGEAKIAYDTAANGMLKGATRPARGRKLCEVLSSHDVKDWTGEIYKLSSNNDGHGVVAIKIARNVYVETYNNDFSDRSYGTLVKHGSPIYQEVSQFNVGQQVRFSGIFFEDSTDCIKEVSLSVDGAMTEPEFLIKFTAISAVN